MKMMGNHACLETRHKLMTMMDHFLGELQFMNSQKLFSMHVIVLLCLPAGLNPVAIHVLQQVMIHHR